MQVWLGSARRRRHAVELLEPWAVEQNDFLARFVARHGAGPHHMTFKVPTSPTAVAARARRGLPPREHRRLRSRVEGSVPHAARSARHRRAARGVARPSRDARRAARLRRRERPEHAPALVGRSRAADRPRRRCAASCCARRRSPPPSASSPACLQGDVEDETDDVASTWCGRAVRASVSRLRRADAPPGCRTRARSRSVSPHGKRPIIGTRACVSALRCTATVQGFGAHEAANRVVHGLVGERELHAACGDEREPARRHARRSAAGARPT